MGLYGSDHARHNIRPPQYSLVYLQQTGPRQAGPLSQQLAIEQEIAPEPFRHREHEPNWRIRFAPQIAAHPGEHGHACS